MKAVILAAGIGSRLRPLTDNIPKCMVEVNGVKIIEKQLNNLIIGGIEKENILVLTGYLNKKLENYIAENYAGVNIIYNEKYNQTNNMYSMYMTKDFLKNSNFLLMNADVFYDENVVKDLLKDNRKNLITCDNGFYLEESMKIRKENDRVIEISKTISESNSYGSSIDVYKFSKEAGNEFFHIMKDTIELKKNLNAWTEVALNELLSKIEFNSLDIDYEWVEIDNYEDLKLAEEKFLGELK